MPQPTTINTIGDLIDRNIRLWAHCDRERGCGRHAVVDLEALAQRIGRDFDYVNGRLPLKCGTCGSREVNITIEARR